MSTHALETGDAFYYEEPADHALRAHLGLRPIAYKENDRTADPRPCPSWCWIGQSQGEYEHEVDWAHPMSATHAMEAQPSLVASQYRGDHHASMHGSPALTTTATIEPCLEQTGQGPPIIRVNLRFCAPTGGHRYEERLRLSVEDARELAIVLRHLIEVAEAG